MGYVNVQLAEAARTETFNDNYWYWHHLWTYFTDNYTKAIVQCWKEEEKVIAELKALTNRVRPEGLVVEATIPLNETTRAYFTDDAADGYRLKWFNIFLHDAQNREGIEIHNYGKELSFNHVTRGDAEALIEFFERHDTHVTFVPDETDD
ncbi:hypothetical protein [Kurthia massiliensis]|uniref:hypothetical protein n=1 Tax=Kurthia massiliensis TaxID=1033739 RepID=UPI000287BC37|nr:hypothetical protein [Kurthia massiliensis]